MSQEWNLHYARWIIEDGQPERCVQEEFNWFSLEFETTNKMERGSERRKYALPASDYRYRMSAEIIFLSEKAAVLDFGLKAIGHRDQLPAKCAQGEYVTGEVALGFPLCDANVPEEMQRLLARRWHVNAIQADMTPYVSRPENPSRYVPR